MLSKVIAWSQLRARIWWKERRVSPLSGGKGKRGVRNSMRMLFGPGFEPVAGGAAPPGLEHILPRVARNGCLSGSALGAAQGHLRERNGEEDRQERGGKTAGGAPLGQEGGYM